MPDVTRVAAELFRGLEPAGMRGVTAFHELEVTSDARSTLQLGGRSRINEIRGRGHKTRRLTPSTVDSAKFSWDRINKRQVAQGIRIKFAPAAVRLGTYRPLRRARLPRSTNGLAGAYQLPSMFPTPEHRYMVATCGFSGLRQMKRRTKNRPKARCA